ncbi:MAG: LamG-like jellyroll fold domain-containing protein, partial [Bacteroidota bacterium]
MHDENQGGKKFLNGIESGSNSTSGQICSSTHVLLIGADSNLGSLWRFFDGKLDDLAIWN